MRAIIGEAIEKIADMAVESASWWGLYDPDIPSELLDCDLTQDNTEQEEK